MPLTDQEINTFTVQVNDLIAAGNTPTYDPDFKVIKTLLQANAAQMSRIETLEYRVNQLRNVLLDQQADLHTAIAEGLGVSLADGAMDPAEVQAVLDDVQKTIEAARSGQDILAFAVPILKFAAGVVL